MKEDAVQSERSRRADPIRARRVAFLALVLGAVLGASGMGGVWRWRSLPTDARPLASAAAGEVLVEVGGSPITSVDLERAARDLLGEAGAEALDRGTHDKLLQSQIAARAIALAAERELDPDARRELDAKLAAERQDLLVARYLADRFPLEAVTAGDVKAYYEANPQRFRDPAPWRYQLLATTRALSPQERGGVLKRLRAAAEGDDWQRAATELERDGLPVVLKRGTERDHTLHPRLRRLLESLSPGSPSSVTFVEGRAYVAQVHAGAEVTPKPLPEVESAIRKHLRAQRLKASVARASAEVLATTQVIRRSARANPTASLK